MAGKGLVDCQELPGRGRGLVSTQHLHAGQIILRESPSLTYVSAARALTFCGTCLRTCSSPRPCPDCRSATFCCSDCSSAHSTHLCAALSRIATAGFDSNSEDEVRFLLAAYHLALVSPSEFEGLMRLEGEKEDDDHVRQVHAFVDNAVSDWPWSSGKEVSLRITGDLLAKEAKNAFGHMAPSETVGQRSVRGFALYPTAAFINHDCLPNSCRFDYIDQSGDSNMDIYIRALHDIPPKVEVTMSYFPINWPFTERQQRLAEEYGFNCTCERCNVEQNWREDESQDLDNVMSSDREGKAIENGCNGSEGVQDSTTILVKEEEEEEEEDDFQHAMFFVKYLCPIEECGGTMAPVSSDSADGAFPEAESTIEKDLLLTMECNMCGHVRTGEEFQKDLEEHQMLG